MIRPNNTVAAMFSAKLTKREMMDLAMSMSRFGLSGNSLNGPVHSRLRDAIN
jgi:hypothetical protein